MMSKYFLLFTVCLVSLVVVCVEASKKFEKGLMLGFILARLKKFTSAFDPFWSLRLGHSLNIDDHHHIGHISQTHHTGHIDHTHHIEKSDHTDRSDRYFDHSNHIDHHSDDYW